VQPLALIRKTDGPYEAIQGLYVTEGDERVYFANVATEGCSDTVTPNSGRLLWVPKSELVALAVGPAQDLESAAQSALEMSYALTPGVETSTGSQAVLRTEEKRPKHDRRLEGVGSAIRPNFGAGLSLSPETASPGQIVTLRMSAPNKNPDVLGFGEVREGRTLRVGGVPADIVKEPANDAGRAEYVETASGQVLNLAKHEPYVRRGADRYVPLDEVERAPKRSYLKLIDKAAVSVEGAQTVGKAFYLPLADEEHPARLAGNPEVKLRGAEEAGWLKLKPHPLTQAWYENRIKFQVPESASSGAVNVECSQLEGQPFLQVSKPPIARIAVDVDRGTNRIVFDGRRSVATGSKISRWRWVVDGLPAKDHKRQLRLSLPARYAPYRIRLYVVTKKADRSGETTKETDLAEVSVLRLPAGAIKGVSGSGKKHRLRRRRWIRRLRHALERTARLEHPVEVDINGFARRSGKAAEDAKLSLRWANLAKQRLLRLGDHPPPRKSVAKASSVAPPTTTPDDASIVEPTVPVKLRAFGHSCPAGAGAGGADRVEVFLLEDGAKVANPAHCRVRRTDHDEWLPPR